MPSGAASRARANGSTQRSARSSPRSSYSDAEEGQAQRHYVLAKYRETGDRVPASRPCPNRVPDTVKGTVSRVPLPEGRDTTGHGDVQTPNGHNRVPQDLDPDSELERMAAKLGAGE